MKSKIFLLLGTNQGNKTKNLTIASDAIRNTIGQIEKYSSFYKTAAWGNVNQPDFYNQVIEINTRFEPHELLDKTIAIEHEMGRVRLEKWGPRIIDIDILFYQNKVIDSQNLTIPHPGILHRKFTLIPLCEIDPEFLHPVYKKNIRTLLEECSDTSAVEKVL
jgi:2-amino-4-hydroxy-6-hydroxymethyldihydropteridine diphosphokinase